MNDQSRRILGTSLGLLMGLVYGLVTETINLIALPGLPLYYPSPGLVGIILLYALGGALVGLMVAWQEEATPGVILGAVSGALATSAASILQTSSNGGSAGAAFALLFITFLPRAILFLPVTLLLAWVLNQWKNEMLAANFSTGRLALVTAVIPILALTMGAFSLYPGNARISLRSTQGLVQKGMQATGINSLPAALKPVDGFLENARGPYLLRLSENPDDLPVQRPAVPPNVQEYAVYVVFENGFHFGCAFTPPALEPICSEY
jgi:hypothetical protein